MIREFFNDTRLNFHVGSIAFVLHRVTGLALCLYVFLHIYTIGAVVRGQEAFDKSVAKFDTGFGHLLEYALFLAVVVHLLNGLRVTIVDFLPVTEAQRRLFWAALAIFIILSAFSLAFFFPSIAG